MSSGLPIEGIGLDVIQTARGRTLRANRGSSMTGRCGACHRAYIRATRWHRRENAAPRPGHERICFRRRLVICPSGVLMKILSSPLCKNISLHPSGKSSLQIRGIPPHQRGVSRSSRTRGADAVDAAASCAQRDRRAGDEPVSDRQHADERCCCVRRSRVVLTPRRWRQVCGCSVGPTGLGQNLAPQATVAKEPGHRGEHEISRKTIACGNAG
jgi:hypothetical protein